VAFSAGGDGGGKPLELMLDSERPNPPPDREQKKAPAYARGFRGWPYETHAISVRETYVNGVLSDAADRL
jgi:hypothetical protein